MSKVQLKSLFLTIFVVISLLLTVVPTLNICAKTMDSKPSRLLKTNNFKKINPSVFKIKNSNDFFTKDSGLDSQSNILISDESWDEYQTQAAINDNKVLVSYEYQDGEELGVSVKQSSDFGETWNAGAFSYDKCLSPSFSKIDFDGNFFGAFLSTESTSYVYELTIPGSGEAEQWDYTNITPEGFEDPIGDFFGFETPDVISYPNPVVNFAIGTIGDADFIEDYDDYDCDDSPIFLFKDIDAPDTSRTIIFFPGITECSNVTITSGENKGLETTIYGVCEIQNNSRDEILFFHGNHNLWTDEETSDDPLINKSINVTGNLRHPKIYRKGDNLYIVAETDSRGKKEIVMFISSDLGESWSEPKYIIENQKPVSRFSYNSNNLDVSFEDESIDIDGYISEWYWDFGEGNTSTDQNPSHSYGNPGTYTVNLKVSDDDGVNDTISREIILTDTSPTCDFTVDPAIPLANNITYFNSTVETYEDRTIEDYIWYLGVGIGPFNSENVTYEYLENGTYVVNLTVIDNESEKCFVEKRVHVGFTADFSFEDKIYELGEGIAFSDESQVDSGQTITDYNWDFGDGTISSNQNPIHSYSKPGYYKVTLTIENNYGHTSSISKIIRIRSNNFVSSFPDIYVDNEKIFVTYMIGNNLLLIDSNDQGSTWSNPVMINDYIYSVNMGYKNSYILDEEKIAFSDFRNGNSDIYFYYTYSPTIDLEIVNVSLTGIRPYLKTKNYLTISFINKGDISTYQDIVFKVTYKCKDENRTVIDYPFETKERLSPGESHNLSRPLFKFKFPEYFDAMVELTDIEDITVRIDPDNLTNDPNQENNVFVLENSDLGN